MGPDPERYQRALDALAAVASGQPKPLFDAEAEKAKAKVRERALKLLDQRARSRAELSRRLAAADFEPELIEAVLDDLAAVRLIDDAAFARQWVEQRRRRRGKSARMLDHELERKGVIAADRAAALATIDPEEEREQALRLAQKKAGTLSAAPADRRDRDKQLRRIVGVLARRGYPQAMSVELAKQALDERIAELS